MRRFVSGLAAMFAAGNLLVAGVAISHAQTPTYAPNSPLIAPGDPGSTIPQSTVPQSTIPSTTVPQSTIPSAIPDNTYTIPGNGLQVPSGNTFDPAATIVTPGTVQPYSRGWYPGYWLGYRAGDPPFGGAPVRYQTNYQGFAAPGGCNTCQPQPPCGVAPCGPQNLDFGRGYDGFFTGW